MNEIRITITRFKCSYDIMEQSLNNNMAACRFIAIFCFGLLFPSLGAMGVEKEELNVSKVELTKGGMIADYSQLPKCDAGRGIHLLSYSFTFICRNHDCPDSSDERQLSTEAMSNIYRMCTLKLKCDHVESSIVKSSENVQAFLNISYECIGWFSTFVDICRNKTVSSDGTIHMTIERNSNLYEKCECSIKGQFHLTLADVRLRSAAHPSHCSSAQLEVNSKIYECDEMANTTSMIFNKRIAGALNDEIITYTANSAVEEPEMIYLTANPKGMQTEVSCVHYPRIIAPTTKETIQTGEVATSLYKHNKEKEQSASASQSVAMVGVGVCITLAIVILVVFLRRRRKQRKKKVRQLPQSQRLQQASNLCGRYSFARDDETLVIGKGAGDYVDLVETHTGATHFRDTERLHECGANAKGMHPESNFDSTSKPKSTSEKLKKYLSRTPKQEKTVYSYATQQPLLRETVGMAIDGTTTNPINQATSSRETHDGPFYFKLESQPEPGADATVPSDGLKRGVNATSNVEISSKKKKKGKQKELDKGNSSTSRCNDTEANEVPHNAVPAVDVDKHQTTQVKKTSPEQKLYANETQNIQSGDDKYETIDVNYSVAPESPNSKELRSPGVLQRILIKITKTSKQQAANEVTDAQNKPVRATEKGDLMPDWNYFSSTSNIDSTTEPHSKASCTQYEYATNQEIGLVEQSNDQIADSNKSKPKGFFGKKKVKNQNQGPNTTTIEETQKNAISPTPNKGETNAVVFKGKQDVTSADEGHYDKLNMGDSIVPQHPNYDKVSMTKHGSSLKHKFKK